MRRVVLEHRAAHLQVRAGLELDLAVLAREQLLPLADPALQRVAASRSARSATGTLRQVSNASRAAATAWSASATVP
jgi:hypothetical protein